MPLFKYYRPNIYLEKAVRYNELYFAANHELNDPHDLKAKYYFEDDISFWRKLLQLKPPIESWNLNNYINLTDESLTSNLNTLLKGSEFDSTDASMRPVFENNSADLTDILRKSIRKDITPHPDQSFLKDATPENIAEICKISLLELLTRAINHKFYSVSFSGAALEPMMWAHYAEGFKGCVIIYDDLYQKKINLRHNLFSNDLMTFEFLKVNYINGEKKVPILECATGGKEKIQNAFLQKNSFWSYEDEFRLLTTEEIDSKRLALSNEKIVNNRQRILHHDTNTIIGVIFGPRCDESFKKKLEHIIRDNRLAQDKRDFFTFETELTHDSQVVIKTGFQCLCNIGREGKRGFEGEHLESLLAELNIK